MPISALGGFSPDLPYASTGVGVKTAFGMLTAPGSRVVAYVRSTGAQDGDDAFMLTNLVGTLAAGLARCRAGFNDIVYVLPGHVESGVGTTMMSGLKAGSRIIGIGQGANMPKFRWTATTDQWAIAVNDIVIAGLHLQIDGANGVVKGINITGADVVFTGNDIEVAEGAALKATIAIEIGTGAHRCCFLSNNLRGTATHNVTDGIKVVGAVTDARICDNEMIFSATAANGNVHVTGAATGLRILRNYLENSMTASTACVALDDVAADGVCAENLCAVLNNGTASSQGVVPAGTTNLLVKFLQNFCSDEKGKSGILCPVAAT